MINSSTFPELEEYLPNTISVKMLDRSFMDVLVEYIWKPLRCSHCQEFGHHSKYLLEKENIIC